MRRIPSPHEVGALRHKRAAAVPLIRAAVAGVEGLDPEQLKMPDLLHTPTEPLDLATLAGMGVGAPYLFSRLMGSPLSLGRSAMLGFGPVGMPIAAVGDVANTFLGPLSDPRYQLGMRGYLPSLAAGVAKNIKQLGEAGHEARERYGAFGIPVQMAHGIVNPVTSAMYLGKNLKDALLSKEGQDMALQVSESVAAALER